MKHPLRALFAPFALGALAACSASSYQKVPVPSQAVEVSSPSVSRVYVMRLPQAKGLFRALRVTEDQHEIGQIGSESYICWEREPGRSLVVVTYEGTALAKDDRESMIDVQAEAGQVYYYGITVDEAWNKAVVRMLDREEARKILHDLDPAMMR
jgi:hypothetical protein